MSLALFPVPLSPLPLSSPGDEAASGSHCHLRSASPARNPTLLHSTPTQLRSLSHHDDDHEKRRRKKAIRYQRKLTVDNIASNDHRQGPHDGHQALRKRRQLQTRVPETFFTRSPQLISDQTLHRHSTITRTVITTCATRSACIMAGRSVSGMITGLLLLLLSLTSDSHPHSLCKECGKRRS